MSSFSKWTLLGNVVAGIGAILLRNKNEKKAWELVSEANGIFDGALKPMEIQREKTSRSLHTLAETNIKVYSTTMSEFKKTIMLYDRRGKINVRGGLRKSLKINKIERAIFKNTKIAQKTQLALMSGGLAIAEMSVVYGGTQFFGKINGRRIKDLPSDIRKDATLQYLGDGSILKGKLMLGGIAITSIVPTLTYNSLQQSKNMLASAETYLEECKAKSIELKNATETLQAVEKIVRSDIKCINILSYKMNVINKKVLNIYDVNMEKAKKSIINRLRTFFGKKIRISVSKLSENDIKTLYEYQQCAVLINHISKLSILKRNGEININTKKEIEKIYCEIS